MDPIRQDATLLLDRLLSGARQVSVVGHTHPDGDALGSVGAMTAYLAEKRGLTVRGIFPDTPPETLRFLCREDFLYVTRMNNRADELANKGIDDLPESGPEEEETVPFDE